MKKLVIIFILVFLCFEAIFGITNLPLDQQPWRLLEQANIYFENGEFGKALMLAKNARENKEKDYAWLGTTLTNALKAWEVQKAGDDIESVLRVLKSRDEHRAVAIIESFVSEKGLAFFHKSVKEIMSYIKKMSVYPEADFLCGKIYAIEGEIPVAKSYFIKTWDAAYALDVPDMKYDILYEIADTALVAKDNELFEQSILRILADDTYFNGDSKALPSSDAESSFARSVLTAALERSFDADTIFLMYRVSEYRSIKAYTKMADFLFKKGKLSERRFLTVSMFGALCAFNKISSIVAERDVDYSYKTVDALFKKAMRYPDIRAWIEENDVWQTFYYFSQAANAHGKTALSRGLLQTIAANSQNTYQRNRAAAALER
ncbi:MAG: hypothetical protein Ta2A_08880 [Treponemataceae bacterium]|nr:MAG: hypothetical protein Ta2A_08880 [Treponemataceae bacterium]